MSCKQAKTGQLCTRLWIWGVFLFLFALSIPWYLPTGKAPHIWLGFPHWVLISLLTTVGIAVFAVYVISRFWQEEK